LENLSDNICSDNKMSFKAERIPERGIENQLQRWVIRSDDNNEITIRPNFLEDTRNTNFPYATAL